jgi:hypothetical protein
MNASDDLLLKVRGWTQKAENDLSNAHHTLTMEADSLLTPSASTLNRRWKNIHKGISRLS